MDYLVLSLSPKLRSMITKATHPLTITITIKMLRQRQQEVKGKMSKLRAEESATQTFKSKVQISTTKVETSGDPRDPSLSQRRLSSNLVTSSGTPPGATEEEAPKMDMQNMSRRSQWLILAVASGACAAFNGVFAKLYVVYLPPTHGLHCYIHSQARCILF